MQICSSNEGARRRSNQRQEETTNVIELLVLKTVNDRFKRRRKSGVWTWWQHRLGKTHAATTNHILFQNEDDATSCKLKSPCFNSDHRLVAAELETRSAKEHQKHVKKRTSFPITIRPKDGGGIGDKTLETLCKAAKELDKKKEKEDLKGEI
jgi:hypothetical protein